MSNNAMTETPSLGLRLKQLRNALGLTQERLAPLLQVTVSTVNRWEANRSIPSRRAEGAIRTLAAQSDLPDPWEPVVA